MNRTFLSAILLIFIGGPPQTPSSSKVTLYVIDRAGFPLEDVTAKLTAGTSSIDLRASGRRGQYEAAVVPYGDYVLRVSALAFKPATTQVAVGRPEIWRLEALDVVVIEDVGAPTVHGRVRFRDSTRMADWVRITSLYGRETLDARVDEDGRFTFDQFPVNGGFFTLFVFSGTQVCQVKIVGVPTIPPQPIEIDIEEPCRSAMEIQRDGFR